MAIKVTTDLFKADFPYPFTPNSYKEFEKLYNLLEDEDKSAIVKILHAVDKYPDVPEFLNLACRYYDRLGLREKATETLNGLKEKFPEFIFWRINLSMNAFLDKNAGKMKELLGSELEIDKLYPKRELFHESEYNTYTKAVLLYYSLIDDYEAIIERTTEATKVAEEFGLNNEIILETFGGLLHKKFPQLKEQQEVEIPDMPEFNFKEVEELYNYDLTISDEIYNKYLEFDREKLIEDLNKVILHAISEYAFFEENRKVTGERNFSFLWHALFLLVDLNARESVPVILEFLRQDVELQDFYFDATDLQPFLGKILLELAKDELPLLRSYLEEEDNDPFTRITVSEVFQQVAARYPERRLEVESYYRQIFKFLLSHKNNEQIYSETLINFMVSDISMAGFKNLILEIERDFPEVMQNESLNELLIDLEDNLEAKGIDPSFELPRLETRKEIYDQCHNENDAEEYAEISDEWDDDMMFDEDELESDEEDFTDFEEVEEDKTEYFYSSSIPYTKTEAEVGRNEPCPCGSGKKYKKCHGKS